MTNLLMGLSKNFLSFFTATLVGVSLSANPISLYKAREQSTDALILLGGAKMSLMEYIASTRKLPASNAEAGVTSPGELASLDPNVESISIGYGTVSIKFSDRAHKLIRGGTMALSVCANEDLSDFYFVCGQDICNVEKLAVQGVSSSFEITTLANDVLPVGRRGNGPIFAEAEIKAADGDAEAQRRWSAVLLQGAAVPRDLRRSMAMAKASAASGNVTALGIVGLLHNIGFPEGGEPDPVSALAWWRYAQAHGHPGVDAHITALLPTMSAAQIQEADLLQTGIPRELAP